VDTIQVRVRGAEYPITFGSDLAGWLEAVLPLRRGTPFVLLLVDENVNRLHGERLAAAAAAAEIEVRLIEVPAGEETKSLAYYGRLCDEVLAAGPDRSTPLIACGGGVTGDAAGFVAATVLRGLPFYQVPTTTLSQADSGVGGKVGLNHASGKNLLGTFYQPRAVFIDPAFTRTLEKRDYLAGLFEVLKMGLILDPRLHGFIAERWERLDARAEPELVHVIQQSCRLKARVVELDEVEEGPRRVLNFGHTVGHVLEHLAGGALRHGEAVAWGMAAAIDLSVRHAGLEPDAAGKLIEFIRGRAAAVRPETPPKEAFMRLLDKDKKRRGRSIDMVLLRSVGNTVIKQDLPAEEIWRAARDAVGAAGSRGESPDGKAAVE